MTSSTNLQHFIFAILCMALVLLSSGVMSFTVHDKICLTKGPCPDNDPACAQFCAERSYPKGGNCIGNLCCCDR
ncbi:hypothetical protein P8452_52135 [Trifolium repens]|nr:hypothetical protein P8452_52135 [Trifolium repens]